MNFIFLLFLSSTLAVSQAQTTVQGTGANNVDRRIARNGDLNDPRSKTSFVQQYHDGNVKLDGQLQKRPSGVPPYAVLMEPLVQYSQPDPLYDSKKSPINAAVNSNDTKSEFVKRIFFQDDWKGQGNGNGQRPGNGRPQSNGRPPSNGRPQPNGKPQFQRKPHPYGKPPFPHGKHQPYGKPSVIFSNSNKFNSNNVHIVHHSRPPPPPPPPPTYTPVYIEEPEPIIEIIIKESNVTLPPPPPLPTPPPPKKKKEQVQVFYVQYQKDPNSYDENKLIYEAPVPAVTPPTNNEDPNEEQEGYDYQSPPPPPQYYEEEDSTLPPPPSTTLKAFIKPESEIFHGTGGLHITFGGPEQEEDSYSNHHGDYYQQSAPLPAIALPNRSKNTVISRISTDSQPTKRNPEHVQSQSPLPPFQSTARPNFSPFLPSQDFQRSTPLPSFQQAPQFPAQTFKSQFLTSSASFNNNQPTHQNQQPSVGNPRSQPSQTYSTLPQNLIQKAQPGHNLFGSSRIPSPQPTVQSPQQYRTINQHQTVQNFQSNVKPLPSQQYHTINHPTLSSSSYQAGSSTSGHSQSSVTPSNSFVQRNQNSHQRPFDGRPQTNFQEHVQHFQPHQIQQQAPVQNQVQFTRLNQQTPAQNQATFSRVNSQAPAQNQAQFTRLNQQSSVQSQAQFNQFHKHQQRPSQQSQQHQQQHLFQQHTVRGQNQNQNFKSSNAPEVIKSISPDVSYANQQVELKKPVFTTAKPAFFPTSKPAPQFSSSKPLFHQNSQPIPYSPLRYTGTTESRRYPQTTQPTVEYVTEDPKKLEEERRKKEEKKKQNIAALPKEVPEDLRQQLLNSGILGNADIQILDYDKIGDIPIESLPPEALANFKQAAGSGPLRRAALPTREDEDSVPAASEREEVIAPRSSGDLMEMKVVRFNPESKEGAQLANEYVKEGATQLDPVVLNDSKYNRYLPLKVSGAQFPVPDVPQLRGRNVTSVVILAPVDYEFLQRKESAQESISRSASPVLEVQGVHFIAGDILKTLVKTPTAENYRKWLDKENSTSVDKQSVVLLVLESQTVTDAEAKEIFMFDIGTQKVSKLKGELSSTFVQVAESNSQNDDLEEISDSPSAPGGDFTIRDTAGISASLRRAQRRAESQSRRSKASQRAS